MVTITTGASAQDVLQGAAHVLFVEGAQDGLDVTVLHELLTPRLRVEPLGASFSVRSVATALRQFHPKYWFVIDRDDWNNDLVEASWKNFPDPATDNLLIWRKKELESYFLEPEWVCNSRYFKPAQSAALLQEWLTTQASKLLWLEAANRVLISKRNLVKRHPGNLFTSRDVDGCSRDQVVDKLVSWPLLTSLHTLASTELSEERVRTAFDGEVAYLSGGMVPLVWGKGAWRDLMSAKALFRMMVNHWFSVPDESKGKGGNARLSGRDAERAVAIDLLKNHKDSMPADFVQLKAILDKVI